MTDHRAGHRQRLRERFLKKGGPQTLPDYEVLELILFAASARSDVKPLAKELIHTFGSLKGVIQAPPEKLQKIKGLGLAGVAAIKAIHEACGRMLMDEAQERPIMDNPLKVIAYCQVRMEGLDIEQFRLLFLDRRNHLIADEVQQEGSIDTTPIFPREVVKRALDLQAGGIILVHNHPSGDPSPSEADIQITRKIIRVAHDLDIRVHDHIIVGRGGYHSFREEGMM